MGTEVPFAFTLVTSGMKHNKDVTLIAIFMVSLLVVVSISVTKKIITTTLLYLYLYSSQLTKVFPDAKIVWAHRHPVTNFSSICGLINIFHGLYYEKTDNSYTESQKVNRRMYDIVRKVLPKAQRDIENFGIDCAHIVFEELVKDPITVVKVNYMCN